MAQSWKYAAFISYKHANSSGFAERLELAIKAYAKPLWRPPMAIFRDEKILSHSTDLWKKISEELANSRYLIYIASPDAARSPWVIREIRQWLQQNPTLSRLIIVLKSGELNYDTASLRIDSQATNCLPELLLERLQRIPLFVDARAFSEPISQTLANAEFKHAVNRIKAGLLGIEPMAMSGQEMRQHRSNLFKRNTLIMVSILAVVIALSAYWEQRVLQKLARSNQLVASAQVSIRGIEPRYESALPKAIDALRLNPSPTTRDILREAAAHLPRHLWTHSEPYENRDGFAVSAHWAHIDEPQQIILQSGSRRAVSLNVQTGQVERTLTYPDLGSLSQLGNERKVPSAINAMSGQVGIIQDGEVRIIDLGKNTLINKRSFSEYGLRHWRFAKNGELIATAIRAPDGSSDKLTLHRANTEPQPIPLPEDDRCPCNLAFSTSGRYLAVSSYHVQPNSDQGFSRVQVFNTQNLFQVYDIKPLAMNINAMVFSWSSNRPVVAVAGVSDTEASIQIHDLAGAIQPRIIQLPDEARILRFSMDDNLLAVADKSRIWLFDSTRGSLLIQIPKKYDWIHDIAFSSNDDNFFTVGSMEQEDSYPTHADGWSLNGNSNLFQKYTRSYLDNNAFALHPTQPIIAVAVDGVNESGVDLIHTSNGRLMGQLTVEGGSLNSLLAPANLSFTRDGRHLIATHWSQAISVWDWHIPMPIWQSSTLDNVSQSPIPKNLDTDEFRALVASMHAGTVRRQAWNGSTRVVTQQSDTGDCKLVVTREEAGKEALPLHVESSLEQCTQIDSLALSPDGEQIVVGFLLDTKGSMLQRYRILNGLRKVISQIQLKQLKWYLVDEWPSEGQFDHITFDPTGRFFAYRDNSGQISVRNANDGEMVQVFSGVSSNHVPAAPSLVFDSNGKWLFTSRGPKGGLAGWRINDASALEDAVRRVSR